MKTLILLLLLFSSDLLMAQETYFFLNTSTTNSEDWDAAVKTKNFLEINAESGAFVGQYDGHRFSGKLTIGRTSSGFVKGFYIAATTGYVQRDVVNDSAFNDITYKLSKVNRLYFYPDMLAQPTWDFLEISLEDELPKLVLVKKH